jgi:voltage-gated potassium channel
MKLKQIIEGNDTKAGRVFDLFIQFLIIISLVSFSIETVPGLSETTIQILRTIEVVTVLLFTLEYILRVYVADKKTHYVFSFYGLIDLLAVLPFYVASGVDLRSIRIFRLLRLFRILKIIRFSNAIERFRLAFTSIREEIILFLITTIFLIYISSVGIYYCEQVAQPEHFKSIFHSLWWSIVTLTSVGYGDVYPVTPWGKIFASIVMVIGIGIVAVPSGLIASALTKVIRDEGNKD